MANRIRVLVTRFHQTLFFQAVRTAMLRLLPIVLIGSFTLAIDSLFFDQFAVTRNLFNGAFHQALHFIYDYTVGAFSIYLAFSLGISIAEQKKSQHQEQITLGIFSSIAFIIYIKVGNGDLQKGYYTDFSSANALEAIIIVFFTVCSFLSIQKHTSVFNQKNTKRFRIFFSQTIANIYIAFIPIIFAVLLGWCKYVLYTKAHLDNPVIMLLEYIYKDKPVGLLGFCILIVLNSLAWFFGIHGSMFMGLPMARFLDPVAASNLAIIQSGGTITNIYSTALYSFINLGGSGQTLSLILAILLFSYHHGSRELAKSSLLPGLFNINEPIIYGLPIVVNPFMIVPFFITPLVSLCITIVCIYIGILPVPVPIAQWTTPPIIMGYINTHSLTGALIQCLNIGVGALIYFPFVHINDKFNIYLERCTLRKLEHTYKEAEATVTEVTLTDLPGMQGVLARFLAYDLQSEEILKQFHIVYQPQFDSDMHIFGVEALLRWKHPFFGNIYPPITFKLASEIGILSSIEETIFLLVQQDIATHPYLKFSINATPLSLRNPTFINFITHTYIDVLEFNPNVYIEVTEQNKLITDETLLKNLKQLRDVGFKLAIDDFSMGHTSLRYLQENKFDLVKLDGEFTKNMLENPKTQNIIDSIIYLGKTSGFNVLAEYVETEQQKQTLDALGCTLYQGKLCSMPIDIDILDKKLV